MGPEGPKTPANDNFREDDNFDSWLEEFRREIDRTMGHPDSVERLEKILKKTQVYLNSPDPKGEVVKRYDSLLQQAVDSEVATRDHILGHLDPEIASVYSEIQKFYDAHTEKDPE
jgi:hypothetical protein